jgi:hypothetical protein
LNNAVAKYNQLYLAYNTCSDGIIVLEKGMTRGGVVQNCNLVLDFTLAQLPFPSWIMISVMPLRGAHQ